MVYSVRIDRIGRHGTRAGQPRIYEARDEADAVTIAAYEVDNGKAGRPRLATVTDAAGRLLFTYAGRAEPARG